MLKKILALVLAGAMVIGSALPAMATPSADYVVKGTEDTARTGWLEVSEVVKSNGPKEIRLNETYSDFAANGDGTYNLNPDSATGRLIDVVVTLDANGGSFLNADGSISETTTYTNNNTTNPIKVDYESETVNLGYVDNIPNVIGANANKRFLYWADSATATAQDLDAPITKEGSTYKATFYAIWGDSETNNKILDETISVGGLEAGDKASFYKVLKWDTNAVATGGWVAAEGFESLTPAEIRTILNIPEPGATDSDPATPQTNPGISAELAAKIADLAEDATAKYADIAAVDGVAKVAQILTDGVQTQPEAGLYVAIITPGQTEYTYNPVFVGADYVGNTTNNWAVDLENSYSPKSVAKKAKITLDKKASKDTEQENAAEDQMAETVAVGDIVDFTVETTIPKFTDNYTEAKFFLTDTLSAGLALDTDSIKVYTGWESDGTKSDSVLASSVTAVRSNADETIKKDETSVDTYTIENKTATGYKVDFKTNYLLYGLTGPQKITVKYKAKVTTDAPKSINLENNTVDLNFSNSPTDNEGKGRRRDETKHYTFDLDANILGPTEDEFPGGNPWVTTEVVKVGIDRYGNEITQTKTLHGSQDSGTTKTEQKIGALQGAEFKLYYDNNGAKGGLYTNDIMKADYKIVSDAEGRLTIYNKVGDNYVKEDIPGIRGLDAGTYWLEETKAPDGYIKAQVPVKIEIEAEYIDVEYTDDNETPSVTTDDVTWTVKELKSYTVKVGGSTTGNYTITNSKSKLGISPSATSNLGDTYTGAYGLIKSDGSTGVSASHGKVQNIQGVELPSTGGIGTTIFYMGGAVLVLLAGVLLVSKRRMA